MGLFGDEGILGLYMPMKIRKVREQIVGVSRAEYEHRQKVQQKQREIEERQKFKEMLEYYGMSPAKNVMDSYQERQDQRKLEKEKEESKLVKYVNKKLDEAASMIRP